jgi:succinate dehydrogenase (or fumarate reductase) cytochrome b subunit, b558 family
MSNIFSSSIGKKLVMSLSGLFLIVFLLVHLGVNSLLMFDNTGRLFNLGAHFMATNPLIKVFEPVLALGFILHIVWASTITLRNMQARPVKYAANNQSGNATFASRNMYVLGAIVLGFLIIHLANFFVKIKFTGSDLLADVDVDGVKMENAYNLVTTLFRNPVYSLIYVVWVFALWFHLTHGFWSAFQTVGLNNQIWIKRWKAVAYVYATIVAVGFAVMPLFFLLGLDA